MYGRAGQPYEMKSSGWVYAYVCALEGSIYGSMGVSIGVTLSPDRVNIFWAFLFFLFFVYLFEADKQPCNPLNPEEGVGFRDGYT